MPSAIINVATLAPGDGFVVTGATSSNLGRGMAVADLNGDGRADLILGGPFGSGLGSTTGTVSVIFGGLTPFASIDVATLNGTNGFRIDGAGLGGMAGAAVANLGDFNGDGIDDIAIGARNPDGGFRGAVYVVYGGNTAFGSVFQVGDLNGANGFKLRGEVNNDAFGKAVAGAGDFNGDGLNDLLVGAPYGYSGAGAAYVVYGRDTAANGDFAADWVFSDLYVLNGTDGFRIAPPHLNAGVGTAVSSAGDINGDGYDDVIVGAPKVDGFAADLGAAYVVFGTATNFGAQISVNALNGSNGFALVGSINGKTTARDVSSAGDVNGDGYDDLLVNNPKADFGGDYRAGEAYVVFGKAGGFAASLNLTTVDGTNGFMIRGGSFDRPESGYSLTSADVNGDGMSDVILSSMSNSYRASTVWVVLGKPSFDAVVNLATLDGENGYRIDGIQARNGKYLIVESAGDLDGDGADEIMIGNPYAAYDSDRGSTYVVYGRPQPVVFAGGAGDDASVGLRGDDQLSGGGGRDILSGMNGDDTLDGGAMGDTLNGGFGADQLAGGTGGDVLNGDDGDDLLGGGDDGDKLNGGVGVDTLSGEGGNDRMDGGLGDDILTGGAGNDYLDGGVGADSLSGGAENDIYLVDQAGDLTIELAGEGFDVVRAGLTWTLADNLEGLELQGLSNLNGTGNGGANNLQGNGGANSLRGAGGVDTLNGNDGDDRIIGGEGNDLLRGGLGADVFVVDHTPGAVLETDQIYDFSAPEGDIIDLSGLYAGTLNLVAAFSKVAGQMTLGFSGGITTLRVDLGGDGKVDYQMKINGDVTGEAGDWLL